MTPKGIFRRRRPLGDSARAVAEWACALSPVWHNVHFRCMRLCESVSVNLQHCELNSEFNNVEEKVFTVWDEHRAAKLNLRNFLSLSPGSIIQTSYHHHHVAPPNGISF